LIKIGEVLEATAMSEDEKDQTVHEEDDQGIFSYIQPGIRKCTKRQAGQVGSSNLSLIKSFDTLNRINPITSSLAVVDQ
jgi:hypothetical protein